MAGPGGRPGKGTGKIPPCGRRSCCQRRDHASVCKGGTGMKGILMKDLYIAKSNIFVAVLSLIAIGLGLSALLEPSAMLTLGPAVTTVTVFLSIVSDSSSKWSKNVIAMPVS